MDLSILNNEQLKAVTTTEGPVMVMAGAGSGKTRVLTYRIAYLIGELGINPYNILAVTFTNKAAREMKERVEQLLEMNTNYLWISTFHSFCARFLRREIGVLKNYRNNFVIIDEDDSLKILKEEMKDKDFHLLPKDAINLISTYKNDEPLPEMDSFDRREFEIIYNLYQNHLIKENLLDFDDLIMLTVQILENNLPILERYQALFSYIMIDEFQDTNRLQYKLVNLLTGAHKNIFIVGDINQSIYSFRGARVENVNNFKKLYNPKVIKLEQNYRSSSNILDIANDVISKNQSFINMHLFTNKVGGYKAEYYHADTHYGEILHIIAEIKKLKSMGYSYKDMAILYRMNSLSLNFENEFVKANIPYVIYGGVGYYGRKEVKDIIAYLRLLIDSDDDFSFKRIVHVPKRKIGDKVIANLSDFSNQNNISLYDSIQFVNNNLLYSFKMLIESLKADLEKQTLDNLIDVILEKTGYLTMLKLADEEDRIDNVMELKSIMKDIMESYEGTNKEKLSEFLMDLALKTDVDNVEETDDKVKLMTFHQSKGLEYKVVFMPAMEQGIFPSFRTMGSSVELEEERRVCYVGITRAQERLYFSSAAMRRMYGKDNPGFPSEFMKSIKKERLHEFGYGIKSSEPVSNPARKSTIIEKKKPDDGALRCGDKVMHKIFGKGIIVKVDGLKITVAFSAEYGVKVLMSNHPSITRI
jgi:DNA helicase-2/ATP-dependent DNA helicase PcrA